MPKNPKGKGLQITISPKDFRKRMMKILNVDYARFYDRFVDEISEEGVRIMKTHVPVRTGAMRDSISVNKKQKKGGGADRRANVDIGPNVPYAGFVNTGTGPSSGRYVPELGRRVLNGTHPGIAGRNFIAKTAQDLKPKIDKFYAKFEINPLKKRWKASIRPSGRQ